MLYINLIVLISIILFALAFVLIRNSYVNKTGKVTKLTGQMILFLIFAFAIVIRVICAFFFQSHGDLGCFEYWGKVLSENKFRDFYAVSKNGDYPPGYLYVLWALTCIKNLFKVKYGSKIAYL